MQNSPNFTIQTSYSAEYKQSNSKFIAILLPISSEEMAKEHLEALWKQYPKATHICYAYRVGIKNEIFRASDDGEPSGTAGKPILNQLYSFQVGNVLLAVIRFYGGIRLGVSGLIEAYKQSAIEVLGRAKLVVLEEKIEKEVLLSLSEYYIQINEWKQKKTKILAEKYMPDGKIWLRLEEIVVRD